MNITSSTALRNDYNKIASIAKQTEEPVYITRNGSGDTVLMDLKSFEKREQILKMQERLLVSEKERLAGEIITLSDADLQLREKFNEKK